MEIRDPVHGTISLSRGEIAVIDSVEYQRLRAIKQLGFAEFSFPGATHNRYIHSIGVCHLAGKAFDSIFRGQSLLSDADKIRLRDVTRLGALLHDIGHGPLSHTTEEVMPKLVKLNVPIYSEKLRNLPEEKRQNLRANHEDYTVKIITDSGLTNILQREYPDIHPRHIAMLVDHSIPAQDDFFLVEGKDFRPILSQLVSSELDVDRMDYLTRDSYFCGTNYGKVEIEWLITNLSYHIDQQNQVELAIKGRALYTFDDFLLSRHHMYLMVYFHHKPIIFEEMLHRYLVSPDCEYLLPHEIEKYSLCTDYSLFEHIYNNPNRWCQRIAKRNPFKVLIEVHTSNGSDRVKETIQRLENSGIETIYSSSKARLSKYHSMLPEEKKFSIYVIDPMDKGYEPTPVEEKTEIFHRYEGMRVIDRVYVSPEQLEEAKNIIGQ